MISAESLVGAARHETGVREGNPTRPRRLGAPYSSSEALQEHMPPKAGLHPLGAAVSPRALAITRVMRVTDALCSGVLIVMWGMATLLEVAAR